MSNFYLVGRVVHHAARPRFSVALTPREDGGWDSGEVVWPDGQPTVTARNAAGLSIDLSRLMREAADFFAREFARDPIREAVIARASKLGLTGYAIAKLTGGAVSENHVHDFLTSSRAVSMGSHKLKHIFAALGLAVS